MIDTKKLEMIVDKINHDRNAIHHTVVKACKQPDSWEMSIRRVDTRQNRAELYLRMEWDVRRLIAFDPHSISDVVLRWKWLDSIAGKIHDTSKRCGYQLWTEIDSDCLEFGIQNATPRTPGFLQSQQPEPTPKLWAGMRIFVIDEDELSKVFDDDMLAVHA